MAERGWKLERLPAPSPRAAVLVPLASILLALVAGGVIIALAGQNPLAVYAAMVQGAVGSRNGLAETLVKMTPLLARSERTMGITATASATLK